MKKHDILNQNGFNVDPELLAHDLAMLMLSKHKDIQNLCDDRKLSSLYSLYTNLLNEAESEINERIKYDHLNGADAEVPKDNPDEN